MSKLKNGEKLPVTVCGGCHNGQFNTSLFNILKGVYGKWVELLQIDSTVWGIWYTSGFLLSGHGN